ncbi:MAG: hypothetical protein K9N46_15865 [Candidatus Marinimicrobia bacterium]|nr:hypothetical protein [Candidatus Neomarinimicrobiota bacterium]MCF7830131.1 hypothetical protein [Candidatus Neomarinimicrobiota bacterium]MCF7882208.1 hypothetical protein [Candidatus Neomarinimicrobiota bacterium]
MPHALSREIKYISVSQMLRNILSGLILLIIISGFAQEADGRIPYRKPITFSIYDINIGGGFYAADPFYLLDSTETTIGNLGDAVAKIPITVSVDILKYNYLHLLWRQNFLDYLIGANLFFQRNAISVYGSESWTSSGSRATYRPTIFGIGLTQSLLYQPFDNFYFQFDYTVGQGQLWLYSDYLGKPYLRSEQEFIQIFGAGLRWTNIDMAGSKVNIGFSYRYHWLPFPAIRDPDNLTPIKALDISSHGLSFNFGLLFGGGKTVGDDARQSMKQKDYLKAKSQFRQFIRTYPGHSRVPRARRKLEEIERLLPYQYFRQAEQQFRNGNYEEALETYAMASEISDPAIQDTLLKRKAQISRVILSRAVESHEQGDLQSADSLYQSARTISAVVEDSISRRMIDLHYDRAEKFVEAGMWEPALREIGKADSIGHVPKYDELEYDLRLRVARGYLQDAHRAASEGATIAAEDFIRRALAINQSLRERADEALKILHAQNWYSVRERLRGEMTSALSKEKLEQQAKKYALLEVYQVERGMYKDMVRELYGPPGEIFREEDLQGRQYELWVYRLTNQLYEYIYFQREQVTETERVKL